MENKISLSIIIVNYNTGDFLYKCLESIKKSSFPQDKLEIIVVDNASSDHSANFLKKKRPDVVFIQNRRNVGFAKANNQAIKKAAGDYVLLLNPDTLLQKETLTVMFGLMERNLKIGVATSKVLLIDKTLDDACHRGFPTPWNAFCHFSGLSKLFPKSLLFDGYHLGYRDLDKIHEIDSCVGAFMFIRKRAGEDVNWLDEDYFWYGEDLDFCYRIKEKGWQVVFNPETEITHFKGISSGIKKHSRGISSASRKTRLLASRARFEVMRIFYRKHYLQKYPRFQTFLVLKGIQTAEYFTLRKVQ